MNRYAAALLLTLLVASLVACGLADEDPALANMVEKPGHVATVAPAKPTAP